MAISKIGSNATGFGSDLTITDGDLLFATAAKGVCLGVTSNTDSNTIDDYEEGTFTPNITADATMGTVSWNHRYGYYTKVGDRVYYDIYLAYSMASEQDVQVFVSGLPFTCSNANSGRRAFPAIIGQWYNNTTKDTFISPNAWINPNSTRIILAWANGGTGEAIVDSDLQSSASAGELYISGQYGI